MNKISISEYWQEFLTHFDYNIWIEVSFPASPGSLASVAVAIVLGARALFLLFVLDIVFSRGSKTFTAELARALCSDSPYPS